VTGDDGSLLIDHEAIQADCVAKAILSKKKIIQEELSNNQKKNAVFACQMAQHSMST
jgi:hypothetical protein